MFHRHLKRIIWIVGLWFCATVSLAQTEEFRYRYVSLKKIPLPEGADNFFDAGLDDTGRVYGFLCLGEQLDGSCTSVRMAFYKNNKITIISPSDSGITAVSGRRALAGGIVEDRQNNLFTAFISRHNKTTLIPSPSGFAFPFTYSVNNKGDALITYEDSDFNERQFIYKCFAQN